MRVRYMIALSAFGRLLRVVFIDDPGLKIICIALAFLMWFYIDGELMSQKEYDLQMKPSDIAKTDSLEISSTSPLPKFKVTVRGPRRNIEFWPRENLRFRRKLLDNARAGHNAVVVAASDIEAEGFTIVSVEPRDPEGAFVDLVSTATEMKNVRVRTRNRPKNEFLVGQPTVTPMQVRVKGAADDLAAIGEVWTEEVDLNGAESDINLEVPIAERMEIADRIVKIKCDEKVRVIVPIDPRKAVLMQTLDVWARVPPGLAMRVDPQTVQVEVVVEDRDVKEPGLLSKISLYVEWPGTWDRPKDVKTVLGPIPVQVKVSAPPRVQVRGVNNGPLPTVKVMGALAGGLQ